MNTDFDIIVIGAGPVGLSFCRSLAESDLKIAIIDPHSAHTLASPHFDGREIALTHPSKSLLEDLGIWNLFPSDEIYPLREAKVVNGNSDYQLHFACPPTTQSGKTIETLGYLVSNHNIRKACYESVKDQSNITWFLNEQVKLSASDNESARVHFQDGRKISGQLIAAADGRLSKTRNHMGIATDIHDFSRTVVVFRLQHEQVNDHTAFECFFYGSTLALLPLSDHLINCVVTIKTSQLPSLLEMDEQTLAETIANQIHHQLGSMKLVSEIIQYPLLGVHAQKFYANRCALLGDAACGMHPVTAHGFNLGLKSQQILSHLIIRASAQGHDIAHPSLLQKYHQQHRKNTLFLYHGTNVIVNLFTNDTPPAKFVRKRLLKVSNHLPFVKSIITKQLTG